MGRPPSRLSRKALVAGALLAVWALPAAAQNADHTDRTAVLILANPGEVMEIDLRPAQAALDPADRHKKINDYWDEMLAANGLYPVAVPTKSASGFIRTAVYHPASGRHLRYHILFKWDYTLRLMLEGTSDGDPMRLTVDTGHFDLFTLSFQAPSYCYGRTDQNAFAAMTTDARAALFRANHCDPTAYRAQWDVEQAY